MKRVVFFLVVVVSACKSNSEPTPTTTKFSSIEGAWEFGAPTMSAKFTISKSNSHFVVNTGNYTLQNSNKQTFNYKVGSEFVIPDDISYIKLLESNPGYFMTFDYITVSTDFTTMTAKFVSSGSLVSENITENNVTLKRSP